MNGTVWLVVGVLIGMLVTASVLLLVRKPDRPQRGSGLLSGLPPGGTEAPAGESQRSDEIIDRMSEGVLVLDRDLHPDFANRSAHDLLGMEGGDLPGRIPSTEIVEVARRAKENASSYEELVEIFYPRKMTLRAEAAPLTSSSGVLVVLQDVTEELQAQTIRREFVAHASHELKSPVASLQTLADAITEAIPQDLDAARRFASRLCAESDRLGKLVNDLLDLSRLEEARVSPEEPCDLAAVARAEVAQSVTEANSHGLELSWDIDDEVWIKGEAEQLALLVRNLLDNAIHYTNEGTVRLVTTIEAGDAVVRVSDEGVGIPSEAQTRVFERFYRVDRARSRARGGTGLGLAIVKHVAELHGGEIGLESELGLGSTFTVRFPALGTDRDAGV